jgi:hypothetical protein
VWEVGLSWQKQNYPPIYTQYSSGWFLHILSMKMKASCICLVRNRRRPAYTQYSSGWWLQPRKFCFSLSIPRTPSISYWVYAGSLLFHTEYTQITARTKLSIRRRLPIHMHKHLFDETKICLRTILSLRRMFPFFYTEYTQKTFMGVLSIGRNTPYLYSVWNEKSFIIISHFQTILSMKLEASCVYSVWKWLLPAYSHYKIEGFLGILSIRIEIPPPTLLAQSKEF